MFKAINAINQHKRLLLPLWQRSRCARTECLARTVTATSRPAGSVAAEAEMTLKVGDQLHGYQVTRVERINELAITACSLHHEKSGAEHLHLARDDDNNCFGVTFRTTPQDSTGVAHILEHLALCGSKNYPCRDPFMKMTSRSLATFMNAMTWPDATMYPFSSTNAKDFENLMRVYLDAVFFPNLNYLDFRQEGWRLEHEDINDKTSPLVFKGVVFNEMKGAFSSSSSLYSRYLLNKLFPSNIYSNESGGDPLNIPNLTYENMRSFYKKHYHPSNAKFFTYGNFPIENHLALINELVLSNFDKNDAYKSQSEVTLQEKWNQPQKHALNCAPDPLAPFPDKQTTISISYLLDDVRNSFESFTLSILAHLLTTGPNSPFYQALISSGLGMDYSPGTGLNDYTKQSSFSVGLQGIAEADAEKVKDIIRQTFEEIAAKGFPEERVEATLHLIELSVKREVPNFGLGVLFNLNPINNHDGDVYKALHVNANVSRFRECLAKNPDYLKEKIRQYFLSNNHQLILTMNPSETYLEKNAEKEKNLLSSFVSSLTDADREKVFEEGQQLLQLQKKKEDSSVLPILSVDNDIPRTLPAVQLRHEDFNGVKFQTSAQKTNEISYFKAIFNIDQSKFPAELVPILPIFANVITKLGAGKRDYLQMDQEIQLRTGGLGSSMHINRDSSSPDGYESGLYFSSHCLDKNLEHMLNLWSDVFRDAKFDGNDQYLQQLVKIAAAEVADGISQSGNRYAMTRAASSINEASSLTELCGGLAFAKSLKTLSEQEDVSDLIKKLKAIRDIVIRRENMRCMFNGEQKTLNTAQPLLNGFISTLPNKPTDHSSESQTCSWFKRQSAPLKEHHVLPFNANYVGTAQPTVPFAHGDYAPLKIASRLISSKYLLREVREIGGAYGGGATLGAGGIFSFYSYRDPHTVQTIDKFRAAVEWLSSGNFSEEYVKESQLATFQEVDKPITPGNKGFELFAARKTHEMILAYRQRLLSVNRDDLVRVARSYLQDQSHMGIAIIGPKNKDLEGAEWHRIEEN